MGTTNKSTLRRAVRDRISTLTTSGKKALSTQIFSKIYKLEVVEKARVVALFASLPDEPQTATIIEQLAPHKRIVLPRIEGDEMEFYDISEGLHEGSFGIMEPSATEPVSPSEIDVMIVPGVAFTTDGYRLGRGKGFYDKYLDSEGFRAYTVGVCFPCQIVDTIPTDPHDKSVELVVSSE